MRDLRDARRALAAAEAVDAIVTARVQDVIKDAAGLTGADGQITWRTGKERETIAWDLVAMAYRTKLREIRDMLPEGDLARALLADETLDTIRSVYTTTKPGSRTFLVPRAWSK